MWPSCHTPQEVLFTWPSHSVLRIKPKPLTQCLCAAYGHRKTVFLDATHEQQALAGATVDVANFLASSSPLSRTENARSFILAQLDFLNTAAAGLEWTPVTRTPVTRCVQIKLVCCPKPWTGWVCFSDLDLAEISLGYIINVMSQDYIWFKMCYEYFLWEYVTLFTCVS